MSLLNGENTISLPLIALVEGGNAVLIAVSEFFAMVNCVFNAGSFIGLRFGFKTLQFIAVL
jgi:hypothetical protein